MASLGDIEGKMAAQEGVISQYTKDLPSQIESNIKQAWSPSIKEALGVVGQQLESFAPNYVNYVQNLGGNTAADLSPMQKLSFAGGQLGTLASNLTQASEYADYLGGRADEMYQKAYDAMNLGYQREADAYNRLAQQYQYAWQSAENEKNRQLQRETARGSGNGPIILGDGGGNNPNYLEALQRLQTEIPMRGISAQQRYDLAQSIINQYPGIDLEAAYEAAGFSTSWNPALNPTKWQGGKQYTGVSYQQGGQPVSYR